jgi:DNA-binding LacI/PurR family transcriptional regulator
MTRPGRRRPGLKDVATLAGVSYQTVSRVINDQPNVHPRTRLLVEAAIAQLSYRPNPAARTLVTGRSGLIAAVRPAGDPDAARLLRAVEAAATTAGFVTTTAALRPADRALPSWVTDQRIAGLIVVMPDPVMTAAVAELRGTVPTVVLDGDPGEAAAHVRIDHESAAYAATRLLLEAGHRSVQHVGGPAHRFRGRALVAGWRRALREHGASEPPVLTAEPSVAAGYQAGLHLPTGVTAVLAADDHLALGIIRALTELGRDVPGEVSVVGYGDLAEAAYYLPPLTTVHLDLDRAAREALTLLRTRTRTRTRPSAPSLALAPTLIRRASVARAGPSR